jgi:hypothetical protein
MPVVVHAEVVEMNPKLSFFGHKPKVSSASPQDFKDPEIILLKI